jgi:dihydrofolate reductase
MIISLIAAMGSNRVIGRNGRTPWNLPEDLRRFRELTMGHALIMGRRTFESIGRSLPGRKNIVVTRQTDFVAAGCQTAASLEDAIRLAEHETEVFICGGGELYRQALPMASMIYLTVIEGNFEGDTTFPEIPGDEFTPVSGEMISASPKAVFTIYLRNPSSGRGGA